MSKTTKKVEEMKIGGYEFTITVSARTMDGVIKQVEDYLKSIKKADVSLIQMEDVIEEEHEMPETD